ncbi:MULTISPECIES: outer membrane protein transport protein [unclassified Salinivibrio]|uniref:outer membrane protein transport protein n=1 Tax=unclassified Salinivibrio TaxID=2636825 RepID=UPI00128B2F8B|nr:MULTISPECIES: outer membrane protein transport protein [unclassified Salinivibrio]MPS32912.1 aromatic hydrocarbon degradation protein [Salinivibrio sp. VYel7]MPX91184.1 aromatic hydrocarbon degradation protein [Salinivibrio sp. VYel1]MPX94299.1 aromatic hydrocarbon degradation protein [Salinivibrio sp. VYel9]MPX96203.1 aromatic hydrocarbon degradation protein [Salinivibrio sp. VYel6]MPY00585.1 aromatic hydrocarbon degradation protein [Salinivibrio sp. VYel4]
MKNNKIVYLAVATALGSLSTTAHSAGFQLAETSATGLGRAFAGEAAMADNASAQFRNPALLSYLADTQVSAGGIYVNPNVDIDGTNTNISNDKKTATSTDDVAHDAVIPNFYFAHQIDDRFTAGLALATNFGMETDLGNDFTGTQFGNEAAVTTFEINPNIAWKATEQLRLGAGIRYVLGEGSIGAQANTMAANKSIPAGSTLKYMEGDDRAWGWQLGAVYDINDKHRVGISYRSEVNLTLDGHAEGVTYNKIEIDKGQLAPKDLLSGNHYPGSMDLTLPATAELSSLHQLTEQWAVHTSINWTEWNSFDKLEADIPSLSNDPQMVKVENWEDNYRFAIGTTYQWDQQLTLRSGVAYDTSAVSDKNRTLTIPETDRTWLSVGAGYDVTPKLTLDAAFTYVFAKDAPVKEPRDGINSESEKNAEALFGKFEGETTGNVWLVGVQASYRF